MILLETERLNLRNLEAKDAAVMYDYRNNEIWPDISVSKQKITMV